MHETMSRNKIRNIEQRTKDLVNGYIRECKIESMIKEINYICLLFYYFIPERWIQCTSQLEIVSSDDNERDDIFVNIPNTYGWSNAHGNVMIDPSKNPDGIITWIIKNNIKNCIIGIHTTYNEMVFYGHSEANYGWWGMQGKMVQTKSKYTDSKDYFDFGDIIKVQLNISDRQLIFYKNNEKTNVIFDDIDASQVYHLAIRLHISSKDGYQPSGQIIDFRAENCNNLYYHKEQQ